MLKFLTVSLFILIIARADSPFSCITLTDRPNCIYIECTPSGTCSASPPGNKFSACKPLYIVFDHQSYPSAGWPWYWLKYNWDKRVIIIENGSLQVSSPQPYKIMIDETRPDSEILRFVPGFLPANNNFQFVCPF